MARQGMTRARLGTMAALAIALVCWQATTTTIAHAALPDGRAYELVSAADKDGGDVIGATDHVRVSDDGNAVEYSSLRNFGDAVGGGVASDYMALRTGAGQGWASHGIYPPLPALSFQAIVSGLEGRYVGDLSRDLSRGVFLAWRPLTEAPAVANVTNLYLRDDLRTPGSGHYQLVTDCPLCITPFDSVDLTTLPFYAGGTPDLDRVLFESALNLADDARGAATKLYEWDAAIQTTTLAGILPDGRPALQSTAGNGQVALQNSITHHAISSDGRRVFFNSAPAGVSNVYMRVNRQSTILLNRSEATNPGPPGSATYWDASQTGSRVFFSTGERLTDDAPAGGNEKLYMYDTTLPDDDPRNLTAINFASGVVGTSADGHTVYFFAGTQLIPGLPPLASSAGLYVWHDGETRFISELPGQDQTNLPDGVIGGSRTSRVSPSGDLVYLSTEPVGPNGYDHGACLDTGTQACAQLYVYTIADHTLRCASCNPSGAPGGASAVTNLFVISGGAVSAARHLNRVISDDGHYVFFTTRDALLPEDINGKNDAYEYDTHTGTVSLISSGRGSSDSYAIETTPDGHDAYFVTRDQLTGWDTDANYDLYDARINGGLPDPTPPPPTCAGQDCHGPLASPPAAGPIASAITKTAGNLTQHFTKNKKRPRTKRCRKGQTRKRVNGHATCTNHTRRRKRTRNR
jgi:hypothetical protein